MSIDEILKNNQISLLDRVDANVIIDRVERYVKILGEYKSLLQSTYNSNTDCVALNLALEYTMRDFDLNKRDLMEIVRGYEF